MRVVNNRVEADIRKLIAQTGISANIPIYQFQSWFYSALAQKEVVEDGNKYPATFVNQLNLLLKKIMLEESEVIGIYRKLIRDYVYMSCFEQNSAQMSAIYSNLLDILAWFRQKRVSMRDLKPDNLFVAGDSARYPLFLRSDKEFSIGIIDVETAVDFEKSKYTKIKQPLLGGTPFYATPSHFIRNEVLDIEFGNLGIVIGYQYIGKGIVRETSKVDVYLISIKVGDKPIEYEAVIYEGGQKVVIDRPEMTISVHQDKSNI